MNYKKLLYLAFGIAMLPQLAVSAPIGVELVVNGGAEAGDTTGWIADGIHAYEHNSGDPYSQGFGSYSFTAGTGPASAQTLSQSIDLTANALDIDNNLLAFDFGVQLQSRSFAGVLDKAIAEVFMKDSSGDILGDLYFEDTINTTSYDWDFYSASQNLLSGTRSIEILLTGTRSGYSSSDGFFDEVSLSLRNTTASVPEPSNFALLALGIAGLVFCRRNKLKA